MAVNKNFVIKNGAEINTKLFVADANNQRIGIGTTVAGYTLHVGGARGGIGATDLNITGIATIGIAASESAALNVQGISTFTGLIDANGGISARTAAVQDLTSGRITFAGSGGELEDSAGLTFDSTSLDLTASRNVSVGASLNVSGIVTAQSVSIGDTAVISRNFQLQNIASLDSTTTATIEAAIVSGPNIFDDLKVSGLSTFVGVSTFQTGVYIAGITTASGGVIGDLTGNVTGNVTGNQSGGTVSATSAAVADIDINRVVFVNDNNGELVGSSNLTFDGSKLNVGTAATIQVNGNAAFAGIVTVGGNLNVTGDYTVDEISARNIILTGIATIPTLGVTGIATAETLQVGDQGFAVTGISTFTGNIDANGTLDVDGQTDLDDVSISGVSTLSGALYVSTGISTVKIAQGIITSLNSDGSTAGIITYYGDGAYLQNVGGSVGVQSGGTLVGYGITMFNFAGTGNTITVSGSTVTIAIAGGGGGGSQWITDAAGITTTGSIGVNTSTLNDADLVGTASSFKGVYVGNGMLVVDNSLNGEHYIGTNFNGLMAGPVTINGVLSVDGNFVVA